MEVTKIRLQKEHALEDQFTKQLKNKVLDERNEDLK